MQENNLAQRTPSIPYVLTLFLLSNTVILLFNHCPEPYSWLHCTIECSLQVIQILSSNTNFLQTKEDMYLSSQPNTLLLSPQILLIIIYEFIKHPREEHFPLIYSLLSAESFTIPFLLHSAANFHIPTKYSITQASLLHHKLSLNQKTPYTILLTFIHFSMAYKRAKICWMFVGLPSSNVAHIVCLYIFHRNSAKCSQMHFAN